MSSGAKKVAVLATDGFEQSELFEPVKALREAGAEAVIVSDKSGSIRGWNMGEWGDSVDVDLTLDSVDVADFDALLIPGGVMSPDKLRMNQIAIEFTRGFFEVGKPVSAICHGPQLLIECDVLTGRELTSYPAIKTDLKNAGARWEDLEVVVDAGLTTSRSPADLPAFCEKVVEELYEGVHAGQRTA